MPAYLGLGLREMHSSDFGGQELIAKAVSFARYGLTPHFHEVLGAGQAEPIQAALARLFEQSTLPILNDEVRRQLSEGRRKSDLWVPGYGGSARMVELTTQVDGPARKFRAQPAGWSKAQALPVLPVAIDSFVEAVFRTAEEHRLIVTAV